MRPKQHDYRKRAREGEEQGEVAEDGEGYPKSQALPIADLPDDFTGEPEDGATYLALGVRETAALPFVSRVPNPYREPSLPPPLPPGPASPGRVPAEDGDMSAFASSSRHPALTKDSWELLFPLHFTGYRKHLATHWPPSPPLPYPSDYPPISRGVQRSDWYGFMNGPARKKPKKHSTTIPAGADEESMMNALTSEEKAAGEVEAIVDGLDEATRSDGRTDLIDGEEQQRPREPLVGVIQHLHPSQMIRIISHLTHWMSESVDQQTPRTNLLPTQPGSPSATSNSSFFSSSSTRNPFPAIYGRWIFALLCVLDAQLSGDDISKLRELARSAMKVGAWRFIRAVTEGEITEEDNWRLGGQWKAERDARPSKSGIGELDGDDETGVDETLAKCWMVVHAVAAGWGQHDLVLELDNLFT